MADTFEISCPCCEATIIVDRASGNVVLHKEKSRPSGSLESMLSQLEEKKSETARKFEREMESQKDRSRLLELKFQEALKRAEKSDKRPVNPLDLD